MTLPLDGTILVTGASSGIGREMARQLAPRAKRLILAARRRERLDALATELKSARPELEVEVHAVDLSDLEATRTFARGLRGVEVLINNAGMGDVGLFEMSEPAKTETMIALNISALTLLTRELLPPMLERGRGGVLNVSSGFGLAFMPGVATYAATKHYVTCFTEALRLELTGTGVIVSQLCPGPVPTEFEGVAGNPVGRPVPSIMQVQPSEVARIALQGFERNRALIIPGFVMRVMMFMGSLTPRWVFRLIYRGIGGFLRKKQVALQKAGEPSAGA